MSTRWESPLTEARPPTRPRGINWELIGTVLLPLLVFWLTVVFLLWKAV